MTQRISSWAVFKSVLGSLGQPTGGHIALPIALILCGLLGPSCALSALPRTGTSQIDAADLDRQVRSFLQSEITAHVADINILYCVALIGS
jgi:hypothetical protein